MMHANPKVVELHKEPPKKWDRVRTNGKTLTIAIVTELIIVGAVLFAAYQFAERYAGGDNMQWWMAIICGMVYAMVELARVPLAIDRGNPSQMVRAVAGDLRADVRGGDHHQEPQPDRRADVLAAAGRGSQGPDRSGNRRGE